jgi:hypothetical protein
MITPASSVISSSCEPAILWQDLHERQKQKEELAKALKKSGDDKNSKADVTNDVDRKKVNDVNASSERPGTSCDKISQLQRNQLGQSGDQLRQHDASQIASAVDCERNETRAASKTGGKRNQEVNAGLKACSKKAQAKAKASEKCTNMTLHHMDARASDALVDVLNSSVTEEGNNNCSLQHGLMKTGSKGTCEKPKQDSIHQQDANKCWKDSKSQSGESASIITDTTADDHNG